MAKVAKRRGRYVIDFYDTYGKRPVDHYPERRRQDKGT